MNTKKDLPDFGDFIIAVIKKLRQPNRHNTDTYLGVNIVKVYEIARESPYTANNFLATIRTLINNEQVLMTADEVSLKLLRARDLPNEYKGDQNYFWTDKDGKMLDWEMYPRKSTDDCSRTQSIRLYVNDGAFPKSIDKLVKTERKKAFKAIAEEVIADMKQLTQ